MWVIKTRQYPDYDSSGGTSILFSFSSERGAKEFLKDIESCKRIGAKVKLPYYDSIWIEKVNFEHDPNIEDFLIKKAKA